MLILRYEIAALLQILEIAAGYFRKCAIFKILRISRWPDSISIRALFMALRSNEATFDADNESKRNRQSVSLPCWRGVFP
jgi:hypothetical protein